MSASTSPESGHSRAADLGLLLLRVVAGLSLAIGHGIGKFPPGQRFIDRIGNMGFPELDAETRRVIGHPHRGGQLRGTRNRNTFAGWM